MYSHTIWNDLFTPHRLCCLGGLCGSGVSRQFNLPSPLGGEMFFLNTWSGDAQQITLHDSLLPLLQTLCCWDSNDWELLRSARSGSQNSTIIHLIWQFFLFFWFITASVSSPTTISCIYTMDLTAALIWSAVSKTVNFLRRSRAHPTSCT